MIDLEMKNLCFSLLDVDTPEPDEKSLITYISSLYDVFPNPPALHPLYDPVSAKFILFFFLFFPQKYSERKCEFLWLTAQWHVDDNETGFEKEKKKWRHDVSYFVLDSGFAHLMNCRRRNESTATTENCPAHCTFGFVRARY